MPFSCCVSPRASAARDMNSAGQGRMSGSSAGWARVLVPLLVMLAGCSTTVVTPAAPLEPVTAFLLDHGSTSSLVMPTADGNMVRYVYGDWNWYALRNTGIIDGLRALLGPSQGTLG